MILIALAIKLTSPGPVFFRQMRLGQSGKGFSLPEIPGRCMRRQTMLFTRLSLNALFRIRPTLLRRAETVRFSSFRQIHGSHAWAGCFDEPSLDEIPQFFCVLVGHMSLVGPRPPLPYEFANYEIWHRRRLLAVKPGITGFWQVEGRSRVQVRRNGSDGHRLRQNVGHSGRT